MCSDTMLKSTLWCLRTVCRRWLRWSRSSVFRPRFKNFDSNLDFKGFWGGLKEEVVGCLSGVIRSLHNFGDFLIWDFINLL